MFEKIKEFFKKTDDQLLDEIHDRLNSMRRTIFLSHTRENVKRKIQSYNEFQEWYGVLLNLNKDENEDITDELHTLIEDIKRSDKF